eukprot:gene13945-21329_t
MGNLPCFSVDDESSLGEKEMDRLGRIGIIFRYFDQDGDGVWNYEEVAHWGEVMKGQRMGVAEYEKLCRTLRCSLHGLRERHVELAYGKSASLAKHYTKLIDLGVALDDNPNHLFLMPGMTVEMHGLITHRFLNATRADVLSIHPNRNTALVSTIRGPLLVPMANLRYPRSKHPAPKPRRALIVALGSQGADAAKTIEGALARAGWNRSDWLTLAAPQPVLKTSVWQGINWLLRDAAGHALFACLLTDPGTEWSADDAEKVGPVRTSDLYEKLVLGCPAGADIFLAETGVHNASLLPLHYALDTKLRTWVSLTAGTEPPDFSSPSNSPVANRLYGDTEGYVPQTLWLTSGDLPKLAGIYRKREAINGWPAWQCGEKRLYSDAEGYWKVAEGDEDVVRNLGRVKSSGRHRKCTGETGLGGDDLPGFVGEWKYALHGAWARAGRTSVSVGPPLVVSASGCGESVGKVAEMVARAVGSGAGDWLGFATEALRVTRKASFYATGPPGPAGPTLFSCPETPSLAPASLPAHSPVSVADDPFEEAAAVREALSLYPPGRSGTASTDGLGFLDDMSRTRGVPHNDAALFPAAPLEEDIVADPGTVVLHDLVGSPRTRNARDCGSVTEILSAESEPDLDPHTGLTLPDLDDDVVQHLDTLLQSTAVLHVDDESVDLERGTFRLDSVVQLKSVVSFHDAGCQVSAADHSPHLAGSRAASPSPVPTPPSPFLARTASLPLPRPPRAPSPSVSFRDAAAPAASVPRRQPECRPPHGGSREIVPSAKLKDLCFENAELARALDEELRRRMLSAAELVEENNALQALVDRL